MQINIFAFQVINFEIRHNFLRPKIIIHLFEPRHNLPCHIIGDIRQEITDETHNEVICTSS
jgi:hypothetical protein